MSITAEVEYFYIHFNCGLAVSKPEENEISSLSSP